MMNDIVTADVVYITKKTKQFIFGSFMECRAIMQECPYIMDFMIFQANFNIYYGIVWGTKWYRCNFITDGIVSVLSFLDSYKFAPY